MDQIQHSVAGGIDSVFSYGNIAVTVLFLCLIGSAAMNLIMYRDGRRAQDKSTESLLTVAKVIEKVHITLAVINERIGH